MKTRRGLVEIFNRQLQTLEYLECPSAITDMLKNQRVLVLKTSAEQEIGNGNLPFLPVIPYAYRSVYDLMDMVRNDTWKGISRLAPQEVTDIEQTPGDPYYIYNVNPEIGSEGECPAYMRHTLKGNGRLLFTVPEVVALTIHMPILDTYGVWAVGSRYKDKRTGIEGVPFVELCSRRRRPELSWNGEKLYVERFVSPSCVRRG